MKIPKKVKFGTDTWTVEMNDVKMAEDGTYGETDSRNRKITLAANCDKTVLESTFVHEILHVACHYVGIQANEKLTQEDFIERIDDILYQIFAQNNFFQGD